MKKKVLLLLACGLANADVGDLLISEIVNTPSDGEFIEIYNNGSSTVDLSHVYLTDATYANGNVYYYQIVSGGGGGGGYSDFYAKFPAGSSIAPGAYQTVALNGAVNFNATYGINPTYEIADSDAAVADMEEARSGSIDGLNSGLTDNSGEVVVLLYWDGQSDLVQDLDYVVWGDKVEAIDKSGVSIDGPDADSSPSTYHADTAIGSQITVAAGTAPAAGNSWQRSDFNEGSETKSGGNGYHQHDETSENLSTTFFEGAATPNAAAGNPPMPQILINEVDAVSSDSEFVELYGPANTALSDVTLVIYDGNTDQISQVLDLSNYSIGADGYLLIGNAAVTPAVTIPTDSLGDGADAVAVYYANAANFNVGDGVSTSNIIDALVYDSGQADDSGLLILLNNGQHQINEDANNNAANQAMARCPNAAGGSLNTNTYQATTPTPGLVNSLCPLGDYYATADPTDAVTLRNSLHEIIDDHVSFPYSGGSTSTWDLLAFADQDPNDSSKVLTVYKNVSYSYNGGGQQAYNREHTWPQSYGFSSGALGSNNAARTDAHHLMMADVGYNSDRGNLYFDDCSSSCTERVTTSNNGHGGGSGTYPGNSNWFDGNSFEVWNHRKGDIARAMFYMDVRYSGDVSGEVDLQLTDDASQISSGQPYMGLLSVLLNWHQQDPVDAAEQQRNERVYSYQNNRNPFIDHPEWVNCIFQNDCSSSPNDLIFANGFESSSAK